MAQDRFVMVAKALGDSTRWRIVEHIRAAGELNCTQVQEYFSLAQPTISHHIGILKEAEIVTVRKDGVFRYLSVVPETISDFAAALAKGGSGGGRAPGRKPAKKAKKGAKR